MDNLFDTLSPDQLAALLRGQDLQERGKLLDNELAQLMANQPDYGHHTTGLGSALGGLGGIFDQLGNGVAGIRTKHKREDNLQEQQKLMEQYAALLRSSKQAPSVAPAAPPAGVATSPGPVAMRQPGALRGPVSPFSEGMADPMYAPVIDPRIRNTRRPGIVAQDETPFSAFGF